MAEKIEIVRLDAEGAVKETLHDDFPAGWSTARTEFAKLRHGEQGKAAADEGGYIELRVGGVAKMSTKVVTKERKKRPSTKDAADKPKKKAAPKKTEADAADDGEPKMKKQTGYMYHNAQNREAAKAELEAENPDMPAKEKNQGIMKRLADMWGKLDDAAKQKWKDDAPMQQVKPKKAKKEKAEKSTTKRASTGGKVTDKDALEAKMAADGWTKEEKKREGSDHVDKYWIDPAGGKKCRSIVEVARKAYPEFLTDAAKAAAPKKAAPKKKKEDPQAGSLDDYYLGDKAKKSPKKSPRKSPKKAEPEDEEMADAPAPEEEATPEEDAMEEDQEGAEFAQAATADAPTKSHAERALEAGEEDAARIASEAPDRAPPDVSMDDGGVAAAASAAATADHRAAEAYADAAQRTSDDPRAREAWAYRAKAQPMVEAVGVNETQEDKDAAVKKKAELDRKTWAIAHPTLEGTKAGEAIVRTEADVADENVAA